MIEFGGKRLTTKVIILEHIINNIDIIIGMDVICELRGLTLKNGKVKFRETHYAVTAQEPNSCEIEDKDFKAVWRWEVDCWMVLEKKTSSARKQGGVLQNFPGEQRKNRIWERGGKVHCGGYSLYHGEVKWTGCYLWWQWSKQWKKSIGLPWAEQTCLEPYWKWYNWCVWWKDEKMETVGGRNCESGPKVSQLTVRFCEEAVVAPTGTL